MEASAAKRGVQYTRVGMFRSDVLYLTPIDIYQTERDEYDSQNSQAMLAPFGAMPINDRMIYGPYEAIEIWATKRFDFIEKYVDTCEPGWASKFSACSFTISCLYEFPSGRRDTNNRDVCSFDVLKCIRKSS